MNTQIIAIVNQKAVLVMKVSYYAKWSPHFVDYIKYMALQTLHNSEILLTATSTNREGLCPFPCR